MAYITFDNGKTLHNPSDDIVANKLGKTKFWTHLVDRLNPNVMIQAITDCTKQFGSSIITTKEQKIAFLEAYLSHSGEDLKL